MTRPASGHQRHRRGSDTRHGRRSEEGEEESSSWSTGSSSRSSGASASHTSQTTAAATNSSPLAMASSARDRLQASARELFKNLEEAWTTTATPSSDDHGGRAVQQPLSAAAPWESALRTVFSACTTGAEQNAVSEEEEATAVGGIAGKAPTSSRSGARSKPRAAAVISTAPSTSLAGTSPPTATAPVPPSRQQMQQQQDLGDHIYAQLFFDDQIRAARAVQGSGAAGGATPLQLSVQPNANTGASPSPLPSPFFPVSSPHHHRLQQPPQPLASPPITATELDISRNLTFDDSISAISAHTLEAMASSQPHHHHAGPLAASPLPPPTATLGASPSPFFSSPQPQVPEKPQQEASPLSLYRSQSNNSRHSKNSHSTRTTESSSFDQWQQEDAKYWAREAQKDAALDRQPPPQSNSSSSRSSSRKHSSKSQSLQNRRKERIPPGSTTNPRSPHRHPHDAGMADPVFDDAWGEEWVPSSSAQFRATARDASSAYEVSEI